MTFCGIIPHVSTPHHSGLQKGNQTTMSIVNHKGSDNLYMKFKFKGKAYFLSTGTTNRQYAEKKERDFRAKLEKEHHLNSLLSPEELDKKKEAEKATANPVPLFKDFAALPEDRTDPTQGGLFWTEFAANAYAGEEHANTLASYRDRTKALLRFEKLAEAKLTAIDEKMIAAYKNMRKGQKRKPATINRDLAMLSIILGEAKMQEFITVVPEFPTRGQEKFIGQAVKPADERIYMAAVDQDLFDFCMILMDSALEPGAMARLRWEDVILDRYEGHEHGSIHGKCRKVDTRDRTQSMTPRLAITMKERWMRMGRPEEGWVFPADRKPGHPTPTDSFRSAHDRMWESSKTWTALKIPKFRLYDLRHTAATRFVASGADNFDLKTFMGWKTMRMADRYVHPGEEARRRAAGRYFAYLAEQEEEAVR